MLVIDILNNAALLQARQRFVPSRESVNLRRI